MRPSVVQKVTKVAPRRAAVTPDSTNPLYSAASVLTNTLLRPHHYSQRPLHLTLNLFYLKCASNVAIIIKGVAISMPMITSDVRWLLHALTENFVCLQVDPFEIFHEPLIYKTKTWLVYVHLVLV